MLNNLLQSSYHLIILYLLLIVSISTISISFLLNIKKENDRFSKRLDKFSKYTDIDFKPIIWFFQGFPFFGLSLLLIVSIILGILN